MAGMQELKTKVKVDKKFADSLKEAKSLQEVLEKVKEAGFQVTLTELKKALESKDFLPDGLLDKIPDTLDLGGILGDALENDKVKEGLGKLGKFF